MKWPEGRWVASLPRNACWKLRGLSAVSALCADDDQVWLRGEQLDPFDRERLLGTRSLRVYYVRGAEELVRCGERLVCGTLPQGEWRPLAALFPVQLPSCRDAPKSVARIPLRWKRSSTSHPPNMLLCQLRDLAHYAEECSTLRLEPIRFALSSEGLAWVWGDPLPSIRGRFAYERWGLALPCGWQWDPPLAPQQLAQRLSVSEGEVLIFSSADRYVRIDSWVAARRSALRMSMKALYHE